jgi:SAM-dependent methyltransferase
MSRISGRTIAREILRTLRRPRRLGALINTDLLLAYLKRESIRDYVPKTWSSDGANPALSRRNYDSYDDYLAHQRDKLSRISTAKMDEYDRRYSAALRERLEEDGLLARGMNVLCLAARRGTEVRAFHALGCFAVGIDLNPGEANRLVIHGDFHEVQFPDGSVDAVFTNSLDHAFDLQKIVAEVRRVLKPGGLFIVEAAHGAGEGLQPGYYESCWWSHVDDLVELLEQSGFSSDGRRPFEYPWQGEHLVFRMNARNAARDEMLQEQEVCV